MKKILSLFAIIFAALTVIFSPANPAFAAKERYQFDKRHTNIMFFASHMGFSDSMGQFMDFDGYFELDEEHPEQSSVEVAIKTASVMTGLEDFDKHLRSADFFDSEKHPIASFKSTKVTLSGEKTADVTGLLTLVGITKEITLHVTLNKIGQNMRSKEKTAGFSINTIIKRSDFAINYGQGAVGDDVKILIETEGPIASAS